MDSSDDPTTGLIDRLRRERLVAVIRRETEDQALRAAMVLIEHGVRIVEITFTTPGAAAVIGRLRRDHDREILVGAGTVTDGEQLRAAHAAGANFAVSPGWSYDLVRAAADIGMPYVPGVLTPTEMQQAVTSRVRLTKLFPADLVGPGYVREVAAVFPGLELMPTGGIDASNAAAWISAGAIAVGIGGGLGAASSTGEDSADLRRRVSALQAVIR